MIESEYGFLDEEFECILHLCDTLDPAPYLKTVWEPLVEGVLQEVKITPGALGTEWVPRRLARLSLAQSNGDVIKAVDECINKWNAQVLSWIDLNLFKSQVAQF